MKQNTLHEVTPSSMGTMPTLVQCVSIPRSGHHYLMRMLNEYFNGDGSSSERFAYCRYYHCCRSRPCRRYGADSVASKPEIFLQKSHDLQLRDRDDDFEESSLEVTNGIKYLIQVRQPIASVLSDFRLYKKTQSRRQARGEMTGSLQEWECFAVEELEYRKRFLEKWILDNPWAESDEYLFLDYDNLIDNPTDTLTHAIRFVSRGQKVDKSRVSEVLARHPVKEKRDPRNSEFFATPNDPEPLMSNVWRACQEKIAGLAGT